MDTLEATYRKNFNKHKTTYINVVDRISEILDELEEKGYDVTSARASLVVFRAQIEGTQNDFDSFALEFQQARELLCEDDISGYRESLKQSRNQLKVLRNNMLNLRSEYQNTVKPELLEIREAIRENNGTAEESDSNPGDVDIQNQN